jgi:hypothetical protein
LSGIVNPFTPTRYNYNGKTCHYLQNCQELGITPIVVQFSPTMHCKLFTLSISNFDFFKEMDILELFATASISRIKAQFALF